MKPEPSPREALEARLTALLLGELPSEEVAPLRQTIAQDAELARLHDRLKQAIELVRATSASPEQEQLRNPDQSKLSAGRREKLLETFKVVRPKELTRRRTVNWGEWAALAAMIVGLLAVAAILGIGSPLARHKHASMAGSADLQNRLGPFAGETLPADKADDVEVDSKRKVYFAAPASSAPGHAQAGVPLEVKIVGFVAPASSAPSRARRIEVAGVELVAGAVDNSRQVDAIQSLARNVNLPSNSSAIAGTSSRERSLAEFGTVAPAPTTPQLLAAQVIPDFGRVEERVAGDTAGVAGAGAFGLDHQFKDGLNGRPAADRFDLYAASVAGETGKKLALGEGTKPSLAAVDPATGLGTDVSFARDQQPVFELGFVWDEASGQKQKENKLLTVEAVKNRPTPAAIALPRGLEREAAPQREPQIRTGPVVATEVPLQAKKEPVALLAKALDDDVSTHDHESTISSTDQKAVKGVTAEDRLIRKSLPTAPLPQPEVTAAENPFSTFSLNVSDVSFQLAAVSLEKGQMPDPATVRSEEFINAFDYRDPEPKGSAPIAFTWERARYPFAHNRDLVRFSIKTAASGRQPGRPLNLVLLLDNSGSMERADRVSILQECLRVLAGQLQPHDIVSVVAFARTPRLWVDGLPGQQAAELPQRVGTLTAQGGTNLEDALNLAYQTALRHYLLQGVNRVVLLTDGAANLGDVQPESLKKKVESHRQQGIALDCFGIGWEGFNDDLLETLSRNGDGRYGFVNTPEAATTDFASQLAGALQIAASDVKVQVEFNPRRATAYRQIGYAKHQLTKEQFRDNRVDAAEIGAAEAGNALYVVQVNPAGEGPIGMVRVRFKVPGTSDYREHEWPVPYEGAAKPLEQASPALRLAAAASAFSEWLVSSPHAGEVTPDRLLGYLSGLPEMWPADPRPKKLEWMLRQAKSVAGR